MYRAPYRYVLGFLFVPRKSTDAVPVDNCRDKILGYWKCTVLVMSKCFFKRTAVACMTPKFDPFLQI